MAPAVEVLAAELGADDLAGALELGLDGDVDLAFEGADDGAAAADAAVGLDLAELDAAGAGLELGDGGAYDLEVGGVDEHA